MRIRVMLLLVCLCLPGYSQVSAQLAASRVLFTNVTAASAPRVIAIPNTGQPSHLVVVHFDKSGIGDCAPSAVGQMEYSMDAIHYIPFGQLLPASGTDSANAQWVGYGMYPYVRFNLVSFSPTCLATGYYSASANPANLTQVNCNASATGLVVAAQPLWSTVATNGNGLASIKACSVLISSNSTANTSVKLYQSPHANGCVGQSFPELTGAVNLSPAQPTATWGSGSGLLFNLRGGFDLCASATGLSAGSAATITVSYLTN